MSNRDKLQALAQGWNLHPRKTLFSLCKNETRILQCIFNFQPTTEKNFAFFMQGSMTCGGVSNNVGVFFCRKERNWYAKYSNYSRSFHSWMLWKFTFMIQTIYMICNKGSLTSEAFDELEYELVVNFR